MSDYIKQLCTSEPEFEQTHLAPIIPFYKSILRIYPIRGSDNLRKVDRQVKGGHRLGVVRRLGS